MLCFLLPLISQTEYDTELSAGRAGENVAIKFIPRGQAITKYVAREIVNHSHLLHPHIVQFKEVFLTSDYLAIAMEYVAGGDMFAYVKRRHGLEEDEARWFFQQLVMALAYSHEIGVVNRDIKLENTLLDGSRKPLIKICDFGYSKNDKDSLPKSKVGTPGYTGQTPELFAHSNAVAAIGPQLRSFLWQKLLCRGEQGCGTQKIHALHLQACLTTSFLRTVQPQR